MYLPRSSGQISQHKEEYGNSQKRIAVIVLFFTMILSGVSFLAPSNIIAQEVHGRQASSQQERISFRVVSWNIENLFDTHHDSLKNDHEYLPDAIRHWNYSRYKKKLVAAICAAPSVLGAAGILEGKTAVCHPGFEGELKGANVIYENVAVDENIITSRGMGTAFDFGLAIVSYFMDDEVVADVRTHMIY